MRLAERLAEHAYGSDWFQHVTRIDIERQPSREAALDLESALIKAHGTTLNAVHADPLIAFLTYFHKRDSGSQLELITGMANLCDNPAQVVRMISRLTTWLEEKLAEPEVAE